MIKSADTLYRFFQGKKHLTDDQVIRARWSANSARGTRPLAETYSPPRHGSGV
jgi:hypothetical protein